MWNEFEDTVFCNRNTDPLPANVSGVVEAFNCQQSIPSYLNWYVCVCCVLCVCMCVFVYVNWITVQWGLDNRLL